MGFLPVSFLISIIAEMGDDDTHDHIIDISYVQGGGTIFFVEHLISKRQIGHQYTLQKKVQKKC